MAEQECKKLLILSAGTSNISAIYNLTNLIKIKYCSKYKIDFIFEKIDIESSIAPYVKPTLVKKHLSKYDYVMWMDADAWFNDFNISIFDKINSVSDDNTYFIISRDRLNIDTPKTWNLCYINSGVFIVKNCDRGFKILNDWEMLFENVDLKSSLTALVNLYDQPFLCGLLFFAPEYREGISICDFNDFNYIPQKDEINIDAFIIHNVGCRSENELKNFFDRIQHTVSKIN